MVVGYLLVTIVGSIVQYGLLAIAAVVADENTVVNAIATVVGSTLSSAISYPYLAAVLTILYFDQRVRKEGFDLQLLADGLGTERDPDAPLPAPLIGDDKYTPEQRAAAPYWPPPPGWVPPEPEPERPQWESSSGWSAPTPAPADSPDAPTRSQEPPLWGSGDDAPSYPTRSSGGDEQQTYPTRPSDDPPPSYPASPSGDAEPTDPLPPRPDEGEKKPKPDSGRADWLPPEAPRGPGGL